MNPYAPPSQAYGPPPAARYGSHYPYKPLGALTSVACVAIGATCVVELLGAGLTAAMGEPSASDLGAPGALALVGLVQLAVTIGSWISFLMWMYRACNNAWSYGRGFLSITPGWAVGWWFIPIASLYKPYVAMRETWTASHDGQGSPLILGWWLSYLGTGVIAVAVALGQAGAAATVLVNVLQLVPGALIIVIMRALHRRQAELESFARA